MPSRVEATVLSELVSILSSASDQYRQFLSNHGFSEPSLTAETPNVELNSANATYLSARSTLVDAAEQIIRLVRGPRDTLVTLSFDHCASATLQVGLKHKFASHIPLEGATTYDAIAAAVGKPEVTPALVERILQHASSFGLFKALPAGHVGHNSTSELLVTDPDLEAWMDLSVTIAYPAGASVPKALASYGYSMEADESAFGASIGRKVSQFQRFRETDRHQLHEMFARAMRGPGHVAMALAKKYPSLRFEVQDLPETVAVGEKSCPEDLKSRIKFVSHDFMTVQPEHSVGEGLSIAYFCRFILHDWSDMYAQVILQQLATGLRPQDRIIINDVVVLEPGQESRERERRMQ